MQPISNEMEGKQGIGLTIQEGNFFIDIKKEYYNNPAILGKIFTQVIDREVAYLSPLQKESDSVFRKIAFRGVTFSSFSYFMRTIFYHGNSGYLPNLSNLYISVGRFKQFPAFPYNTKERGSYTKPFFKNELEKYLIGYDLYFDFDLNSIQKKACDSFIKEIETFVEFLDKRKIVFQVAFSGSRGFKFLIPNYVYAFSTIKNLQRNLINKMGFKFCDYSGIGIISKLMKCPYSIVLSGKKIPKICIPLSKGNSSLSFNAFLDYFSMHRDFEFFNYNNISQEEIISQPIFYSMEGDFSNIRGLK